MPATDRRDRFATTFALAAASLKAAALLALAWWLLH
jgi:hypothetical protein